MEGQVKDSFYLNVRSCTPNDAVFLYMLFIRAGWCAEEQRDEDKAGMEEGCLRVVGMKFHIDNSHPTFQLMF